MLGCIRLAHELSGSTEDGNPYTESGNDLQRADFRSDEEMPDYLENSASTTESSLSELSNLTVRPLPSELRSSFDPSRYISPGSGHIG